MMSKGSQGQKQPTYVSGNSVRVAEVKIGEIAGAKERQDGTTRFQRSEIARKAASAR